MPQVHCMAVIFVCLCLHTCFPPGLYVFVLSVHYRHHDILVLLVLGLEPRLICNEASALSLAISSLTLVNLWMSPLLLKLVSQNLETK